ncbi:MAG: hypothetical protein JWO59_3178, partial [Chloroflexi bacterium]|nr:hypothetical protein [Chloroflexota bacterium]
DSAESAQLSIITVLADKARQPVLNRRLSRQGVAWFVHVTLARSA